MKSLKGTKTHANLKDAFAGESQANRRYLYFAKIADVEGQPEIAGLFRDTAEGETGHAHGHLDYLKQVGDPATDQPIGDSMLNLKSAVHGETYEYTNMYPGMAKIARELGQLLGARDAEHLLHHRALKRAPAGPVGEFRNHTAELAEAVRIAEHLFAHAQPMLAALDRARPQHQAREVELELVAVVRRVRASHLAQLAAVAQIDHALLVRRAQAAHIAVGLVERAEQFRERWAQVEAQPAARADVEDALEFLFELRALPVLGLVGIVGKSVGRSRLDTVH